MVLKFEVIKNNDIDKSMQELIFLAYRRYYLKVYGYDSYEAFLKITNLKNYNFNKDNIEKYKECYNYLNNILTSIKNKEFKLLLIYNNDILIGFSRIYLNKKVGILQDLALLKFWHWEKNIFKEELIFLENYFKNLKMKKMKVLISLKDVSLLAKAINLGFTEDPEDVKVDVDETFYTLSKNIGSN